MAPELFANKPSFTQKADVWGLGVVLYEMCELHTPFQSIAEII
jgi:serine/threonine protein kinase